MEKLQRIKFAAKTYSKSIRRISVVFVSLAIAAAPLIGCKKKGAEQSNIENEIRVLVESSPATMNPRHSLDAIGQRLQMLVFRALTGLDENLEAVPDLSKKWRFEAGGRRAVFTLGSESETDHAGTFLTHARILRCVQNYLSPELKSPHRAGFPNVTGVKPGSGVLVFELSQPDPYLAKNLSMLRYFGIAGDPDNPCRDPKPGEILVTNGRYSVDPYPATFERTIRLLPREPLAPVLRFEVVREETSRLLKLMGGEGDVVMNSLSPTKSNWITADPLRGFRLVARDGVNTTFLAFNLRDPVLRSKTVRQAIARAIDRRAFVDFVLRRQATVASSFLSPSLPEGIPPQASTFDPASSIRLLEEAGYFPDADGVRLRIRYKTTTDKVGLELAQVLRGMLGKVGIHLDLEPVEPSVFFASIRKGNFQMHMGRWIGVSDGSIYHRALRSTSKDNRVGYADPLLDRWIEETGREVSLPRRREILAKIQLRVLEELPYFPLWHWSNALVLSERIEPIAPETISLTGSYTTLTRLRLRKTR